MRPGGQGEGCTCNKWVPVTPTLQKGFRLGLIGCALYISKWNGGTGPQPLSMEEQLWLSLDPRTMQGWGP